MAEVPTSTIQPGMAVDATDLRTQDTPASRYGTDINRLADFGNRGGSMRSPLQHSEVSGTAMMGLVPNFENNYKIQPPDRQSSGRPFTSESPSQRSEKEEFQDIFSELMTGTEHEIAFLTRHFAEVLGPWYARGLHFSPCFNADITLGWIYPMQQNSSPFMSRSELLIVNV